MMQKSRNWEEISGKDGKYRIGMLVYIGLYINWHRRYLPCLPLISS